MENRDIQPATEGGKPSARVHASASISHVMRTATIVHHDSPVSAVPELFLRTGAPVLVVVDDTKHPLGVIRPSDLVDAAKFHRRSSLVDMSAEDVATRGWSFPMETTIDAAARTFSETDRDFSVVVESDGTLAGIVTPNDVLRGLGF